jgi:hypothetical protein
MDWHILCAVLLCGGTVRKTVEYYETLRETLNLARKAWKTIGFSARYQKDTAWYYASHA